MWRRSRYRRERILLPGEREGRRTFLKWGLAGTVLLAVGGGAWLATRRTRPVGGLAGPFVALAPEEVAVLVALSDRLVPARAGFPAPLDVEVPRRVDAIVAMSPEPVQQEIRQLVRLFENALAGFVLDGQLRTFTDSSPEQQDARIRAWQASRYTLRRTGYKALKKLVYAAYYGAPATWPALGYPGPPSLGPRPSPREKERERPEPPPEEPRRPRAREGAARPLEPAPAPAAIEEAPAPRSGMDLPPERRP
jgi:hypothetical protein